LERSHFQVFFNSLIKFNVSPVCGTAHVVTVFHLFPCPGQHHVWGDGCHTIIDNSLPEMVRVKLDKLLVSEKLTTFCHLLQLLRHEFLKSRSSFIDTLYYVYIPICYEHIIMYILRVPYGKTGNMHIAVHYRSCRARVTKFKWPQDSEERLN